MRKRRDKWILIVIGILLLVIINLIVISQFLPEQEPPIKYYPIEPPPRPLPLEPINECENGLMAYYSFDNNANDDSCNKYNGIVNGATHITEGQKLGSGAYEFDGVNDGIDIPIPIPDIDFSVTMWAKAYDDLGTDEMRMCFSDLNHVMYIQRSDFNGDDKFLFLTHSQPVHSPRSPLVTIKNTWYFVAVVHNETEGTNHIWINADYHDYGQTYPVPSGGNLIIGNYYNTVGFWNGMIDEVGIWNRALSLSEIKELYNEGEGYNPYSS